MSKKLYDYVLESFSFKRKEIKKQKSEWLEADYAAFLDWGSGCDVQPLKTSEVEEILWDQLSHKDNDSYELFLHDENGDQYTIKIKKLEWELEEV